MNLIEYNREPGAWYEYWDKTSLFHVAERYGKNVALLASAVYDNLPRFPWGFGSFDLPEEPVPGFVTGQASNGVVVVSTLPILNDLLSPLSFLSTPSIDSSAISRLDNARVESVSRLHKYLSEFSPQSAPLGILNTKITYKAGLTLALQCAHWDIAPVLSLHGYHFSGGISPEDSVDYPQEFFSNSCTIGKQCVFVQIEKD